MWKKVIIDGEETNYSVSSEGEIRNDKKGGVLLKGSYNTNEYHIVQLSIHGKSKNFQVHRLVAQAFCENPNNYNIVDHIDHNHYNNKADNLRWTDNSGNGLNSIKPEKKIKNKKFIGEFNSDWQPVFRDNHYMINLKTNEVVNIATRNILVPQDRHGYKRINLASGTSSLHILVWETQHQQSVPAGMQIDHIDGNKSNNFISNLRLVSPSDNMKNAHLNDNNNLNSIEISAYDKDGNFVKKYRTIQEAADDIGVTHAAVRTASEREGTCAGYYWIKEGQDINKIIDNWIPEGYIKMKNHPTYCINSEGDVYNKRNKKSTPVHYRADGVTKYVVINSTRLNIKDLLKENDLL